MTVEIKGIKLNALHGVLESEKAVPQEFSIDITYEYDGEEGAKSDDISLAVDYAEVCKTAYSVCAENSFCLLEKLSREIAFALAEKFPAMEKVNVRVHKPHAPVGLPFGDISVLYCAERQKVILSLGSNMGDKKSALDGAVYCLGKLRGVRICKVSDYIATKPYGGAATAEFLNCAVEAECLISPRELLGEIHKIESAYGRVRAKRWGDRTLDIDIIFFGGKIIEEEGLCVPHPDYSNRAFVLEPIKQIAPDFVCPVAHKRIADLPVPRS